MRQEITMTKKKTHDHHSLKKSRQSRFGISTFKREKKGEEIKNREKKEGRKTCMERFRW